MKSITLAILTMFLLSVLAVGTEARLQDNVGSARVAQAGEVIGEKWSEHPVNSCIAIKDFVFNNPEYEHGNYRIAKNYSTGKCMLQEKQVVVSKKLIKTKDVFKWVNGALTKTPKYKYHYENINGTKTIVLDYVLTKKEIWTTIDYKALK